MTEETFDITDQIESLQVQYAALDAAQIMLLESFDEHDHVMLVIADLMVRLDLQIEQYKTVDDAIDLLADIISVNDLKERQNHDRRT